MSVVTNDKGESTKLRVELSMLKTQHQALQKELESAHSDMVEYLSSAKEEKASNLLLESKVNELQDQNRLL